MAVSLILRRTPNCGKVVLLLPCWIQYLTININFAVDVATYETPTLYRSREIPSSRRTSNDIVTHESGKKRLSPPTIPALKSNDGHYVHPSGSMPCCTTTKPTRLLNFPLLCYNGPILTNLRFLWGILLSRIIDCNELR